jgi:hypothetical protein
VRRFIGLLVLGRRPVSRDSISPAQGWVNAGYLCKRAHSREMSPNPCPFGQGTGLHSLTFESQNTGLTPNPTEFSMNTVANQGSRFR